MARRAIDGEREEIGRFAEVGHQAALHDEVDENEDVDDEDGEEDDDEAPLVGLNAAGGVLLRAERGVEVLGLRRIEYVTGVVLPVMSISTNNSKDEEVRE